MPAAPPMKIGGAAGLFRFGDRVPVPAGGKVSGGYIFITFNIHTFNVVAGSSKD